MTRALGGRSTDSSFLSAISFLLAGRSILVWGASLCVEWLFPDLGSREELDFSSCTSAVVKLISLVLLPWRQASS